MCRRSSILREESGFNEAAGRELWEGHGYGRIGRVGGGELGDVYDNISGWADTVLRCMLCYVTLCVPASVCFLLCTYVSQFLARQGGKYKSG